MEILIQYHLWELCESLKLQITEGVLINDPSNDRILTRSQTKNRNINLKKSFKDSHRNKDEIAEIEDRNDPPNKGSNTEDDKTTDDEEERSVVNNDNENQIPRINPSIIDIQTF